MRCKGQGLTSQISKPPRSDHSELLIEHGERLKSIEDKQDTHTETMGQIVTISEGHTKRFDQIETTMATRMMSRALRVMSPALRAMLVDLRGS